MSGIAATGVGAHPGEGLAPGQRLYAIGDIHGRFDLLQELAERISRDLERSSATQTTEIFLGDYIDRGPQSAEVVEWLIAAPPLTDQRVCLLGNHEDMLLKGLRDPAVIPNWLFNGAGETMLSYGIEVRGFGGSDGHRALQQKLLRDLPEAHLSFYSSLKRTFAAEPYLFVHAGVRPGRPLTEQDPDDLVWIREPFLHSDADFGSIIVHGHTPVRRPEIRPNRINIDTGAVFAGCLTCLVLEGSERRFLQTGAS